MNGKIADSGSIWIDPDDAPELTDDMFDKADLYEGDRFIRRGRLSENPGLDLDVLLALIARGGDWRERMNMVLREWLASHPISG